MVQVELTRKKNTSRVTSQSVVALGGLFFGSGQKILTYFAISTYEQSH